MTDKLLEIFFQKERWEKAIQKGVDKKIKPSVLKSLCLTDTRLKIYRQIRDGQYRIKPPHEARIPKDNGDFRTVYVNEARDRILLSILNDMLFELCPETIHCNCKSYQTGLSCGKTVKEISKKIQHMDREDIGVKIDLSKYFDSVPIQYIDKAFDYIEQKFGQSPLVKLLRIYYHDNTVLDLNKKPIQKYSSLRQGCAVAAWLADTVLYDIDEEISKLDVIYIRYSDDILIIGKDWKQGFEMIKQMLAEKELVLNPKKIEYLQKNRWFKFLGFNLKNNLITLSKTRVKDFQKEISNRTIYSDKKSLGAVIYDVQKYLYIGNGEYSWATSVLPVINCDKDIQTLNNFVMDAIRAYVTKNTRIGGLGCQMTADNYCIVRGTGRHVRENRKKVPKLYNYLTLNGYKKAISISKYAIQTIIMDIAIQT